MANTIIAGRVLPAKKHVWVALKDIYGIGITRARAVCKVAQVNQDVKVSTLTDEELDRLREAISAYTIEGDLRREIRLNIKQHMDIGTYRGKRHRRGLPVRGQRTRTNACTRKGRRGKKKGSKS